MAEEIVRDLLLVLAPLVTLWLQQRFEDRRQSRAVGLEREKLTVENMRWASSGHLDDITTGLKKVAKAMFALTQAVAEVRMGLGYGFHQGLTGEHKTKWLENAFKSFTAADGLYVDALNEVSVYLSEDEEKPFREFQVAVRVWIQMAQMTGDEQRWLLESKNFGKVNEQREKLRQDLRTLLAPKNILKRLSKE